MSARDTPKEVREHPAVRRLVPMLRAPLHARCFHLCRLIELIRSALPCFQKFDRKNGIPDIKQRIEHTDQGRLVCQSPYEDRHRIVLLVAFVLYPHPATVIGPVFIQDTLNPDPVRCWL